MAAAKHRHEPDDGAATEHHPLDAARQARSGCQPGFGALSRVAERVCVQSPYHFSPSFPIFIAEHLSRPVVPPLYLLPRPAPPTHPPSRSPAAHHFCHSPHFVRPPPPTAHSHRSPPPQQLRPPPPPRPRTRGPPTGGVLPPHPPSVIRVLVEAFPPCSVVICPISGWAEASTLCPSKLSVNRTNRPANQRR